MPAHLANAAGVAGPKTCRYRRASSPQATRGSSSGRGTVQTSGARAPSQRISTVPVGAAYRTRFPCPTSRSVIRRPSRTACKRTATSSARCRLRASSGSLPSVKTARSRAWNDIRAVPRPPHLHERRVLPDRRVRALDTRVDREERSTRHAVLQAGPRRTPQRVSAGRKTFVECADAPPERQDLRPRQVDGSPIQQCWHPRRLRFYDAGGSRGVGSTRARAAPRLVALEGIAPRVGANRAVGPERLLVRDRRRRAAAALRPARCSAGDRAARGRPRDGDRAHRAVARARRTEPGRAPRRAGLHAPARYGRRPPTDVRLHRAGRLDQPGCAVAARQGGRRGALVRGGDRLPVGVEAFPGHKRNDLVLWVESQRAVVAGDTLADFGDGPQINPRWLVAGVTREQVVGGLPAARAAGGAPARDARRPLRPDRPRARAPDVPQSRSASRTGWSPASSRSTATASFCRCSDEAERLFAIVVKTDTAATTVATPTPPGARDRPQPRPCPPDR